MIRQSQYTFCSYKVFDEVGIPFDIFENNNKIIDYSVFYDHLLIFVNAFCVYTVGLFQNCILSIIVFV